MNITILHSPYDPDSRAFIESLAVEIPAGDDVSVTIGADSVRIVSDHAAAMSVCPNFGAYPTALVDVDGVQCQLSAPKSWADVLAWAANPAPQAPKSTVLSKYDFSQRMTPAERIGIREAAKTDPQVEDFTELLALAQDVDLADANMQAGLGLLVFKGLLTQARADEILTA